MTKRRSNGEGSYYYDEVQNRWTWKGYYRDVNGANKRKTLTAKKRSVLRQKVLSWQNKLAEGMMPTSISLAEYATEWLNAIRPSVKPRTIETYATSLRCHILPTLGAQKLNKITPSQIQTLLNHLATKYKASTVNTVRRHLIILCNAAVDNGALRRNPARLTKPVKDFGLCQQQQSKILTRSQLQSLLYTVTTKDYLLGSSRSPYDPATVYMAVYTDVLVSLLSCTGMRIGEALALTWNDFITKQGTPGISINKTLVNGTHGLSFGAPKTSTSVRYLLLPDTMAQKLRKWQSKQKQYADDLGDLFENSHNLIFANSHGNPMSYSNWSRRYWHKATAAAGLPKNITPHCLRHTLASLLIARGTPIQVVSRQLGHSGTDVTLRIYTHLVPGTETLALKFIESLFEKKEDDLCKSQKSPSDAATSNGEADP